MNIPRRRIAIFSAYYPPHLGGVEIFTLHMGNALSEMGHDVAIVTSSLEQSAKREREKAAGMSIIEIPSRSIMNDRFPLIIPGNSLRKAIAEINQYAPTDVVINTRYYPLSLLGCIIAKKLDSRVLVIDHSSGYLSEEKNAIGLAMRLYERIATSIISSYHPKFASVSKKGAQWTASLGLETIGTVPNSIDANKYMALSSGRAWREELNISRSSFVVTFASRLIPEKGISKLLEAAKLLRNQGCDFTLVVAGDGPLKNGLVNSKSPWMKYVGRLNQADLSALLKESDCFCLPTEYPEGLPTILLEAAVQNNAIIVSDCAGAREIIPNKKYGIVLEEVSAQSIADAIMALLENRELTSYLANNASRHVKEGFSWKQSASQLIKLLDQK